MPITASTPRLAHRRFTAPAAIAGALTSVAAGVGCGSVPLHTHRQIIDIPLSPHPDNTGGVPIEVETANGAVRLSPGDPSNARVVAEVRATSAERARETRVLAAQRPDGTLGVRVAWPEGARGAREGASLDITGPSFDGVRVRTSNDPVVLIDQRGEAIVRTSNDEVRVSRHVGPLRVRTSNDPVVIVAHLGPVEVRTSNDPVRLTLAEGAVGPFRIETSNDPVRVTLPASYAGSIEADATGDDVVVKAPKRDIRVERLTNGSTRIDVGAPGVAIPRSYITTSNARIRITLAETTDAPQGQPIDQADR